MSSLFSKKGGGAGTRGPSGPGASAGPSALRRRIEPSPAPMLKTGSAKTGIAKPSIALPALSARTLPGLTRGRQQPERGQLRLPSKASMMKALQPKFNLRDMTSFDPAAGRGYRIGDQIVVPAMAGFAGNPPTRVANHGSADVISRWKVTFFVRDPEGNDSSQLGSRLRMLTLSKMENDLIPRRCTVTLGDAQVIYAPGRSLQIFAFNPMPFDLVVEYNLDEVTAGLSRWEDVEFFSFRYDLPRCPGSTSGGGLGDWYPNPPTGLREHDIDEMPLDIPPFCSGFAIYSNQISPAFSTGIPASGIFPNLPLIRAYGPPNASSIPSPNGPLGAILYQDIVLTPHSPFVDRVPGLDYTIRPYNPINADIAPLALQNAGDGHVGFFFDVLSIEYSVYYNCDG